MNGQIRNILEKYKNCDISLNNAVSEILKLSIILIDNVENCNICKSHILVNGICPQCTIDFCTPPDSQIKL